MAVQRVILAFDYEEVGSKEEALRRAQVVHLRSGDSRKIFVIAEELPWPTKKDIEMARKSAGK